MCDPAHRFRLWKERLRRRWNFPVADDTALQRLRKVSGEPRSLTPTLLQSEDENRQTEHLTPHASSRSRYLCFSGPKTRSLWSCASSVFSSLVPTTSRHSERQSGRILLAGAGSGKGKGKAMAGQRRPSFRMSDMMPNAWFYKLRDMRARGGRGPAAPRPRSLSARWEVGAQPPSSRSSRDVFVPSSPSPGNREEAVDVQPLHLRRASYYTATRDRELALAPPPGHPRRRRHRAAAPGEKEPFVVDAPVTASSHRRRDMSITEHDAAALQKPMASVDPADDDSVDNNEGNVTNGIADAMATGAGSASEKSKPRSSSSSAKPAASAGRCRIKTRVGVAKSPRLLAAPATARKGGQNNRPASPPPDPILDSYAVVVLSSDLRKDFRESMEEMIADKGIRDAADLEDLLACYLVLNEAKFHEIIVDVFEEVWISLANARP